jgi:hypothetical protein
VKGALAGGEPAIAKIVMGTHAGMTTEEFEQIVQSWLATAKHPVSKRPYTEMIYQPMLELLAYLRANDFKTFIVSDGDLQMLQYTAAGPGARFCLYVHHGDAGREWAYDRKSHIGQLDKGLDEAKSPAGRS